MATGARGGGELSGAHWDHRTAARDTARGSGWYTNTGHNVVAILTVAVDAAAFSCINRQKMVVLV